jgi:hypothetical protein
MNVKINQDAENRLFEDGGFILYLPTGSSSDQSEFALDVIAVLRHNLSFLAGIKK